LNPVNSDPSTPPSSDSSPSGPGCDSFSTPRDRRNLRAFNLALFAMALCYVGASAALRWHERVPAAVPWVLFVLATIFAVDAARRYLVYLRQTDELLRRIQTEALAIGFGAGAASSLLFPLAEKLGVPGVDGRSVALVMILAWSAGSWAGMRRYRNSA